MQHGTKRQKEPHNFRPQMEHRGDKRRERGRGRKETGSDSADASDKRYRIQQNDDIRQSEDGWNGRQETSGVREAKTGRDGRQETSGTGKFRFRREQKPGSSGQETAGKAGSPGSAEGSRQKEAARPGRKKPRPAEKRYESAAGEEAAVQAEEKEESYHQGSADRDTGDRSSCRCILMEEIQSF